MTAAMVLSAGLGTRLLPLTRELPKPLMPVGDRPALAHIVSSLECAGVAPIVVNTHHLAEDFTSYLGALAPSLHVSHEPKILGTAGGVAFASTALRQGDLIVWNGDILAPALDVRSFMSAATFAGAAMTWVVEPLAVGSGTVGLDERGDVVRLRGERFGREVMGGDYLGILHMGADARSLLPSEGCLVGDVALPLLRRGGRIGSYRYEGAWDDIGSPATLLRANQRWLDRRGTGAWRADDAAIGPDVTLERSVVGARARITGSGLVRDCVVFAGATLAAPCVGQIVGIRNVARVGDAD